jgi:hypothetical protein
LKEKKLLKDQQNQDAAKEHRDAAVGTLEKKRKKKSDDLIASDLSDDDGTNSKPTHTKKERKAMFPSLAETMEKREVDYK